jgi:hypothetical protein
LILQEVPCQWPINGNHASLCLGCHRYHIVCKINKIPVSGVVKRKASEKESVAGDDINVIEVGSSSGVEKKRKKKEREVIASEPPEPAPRVLRDIQVDVAAMKTMLSELVGVVGTVRCVIQAERADFVKELWQWQATMTWLADYVEKEASEEEQVKEVMEVDGAEKAAETNDLATE